MAKNIKEVIMKHSELNEEQVQALWNRAEAAGMSRRKFIILLGVCPSNGWFAAG